ncbi:MAG: right-handed parallel beta-helix repeat-containing protein [Methyloceanibacter sp.]
MPWEGVFIDDAPLSQVLSKDQVAPGRFYLDYAENKLYLADDPTGHKVEATVDAFAFESLASNVLIKNLVIEKYASVAQKGAIQGIGPTGWIVENSELRLNSGAAIGVGTGGRVRNSDLHHNGQSGIAGTGKDIQVENTKIWANNIYGFDPGWQAGGLKLALADGVVLRGNHVYDNIGPGLWCDIDCRNVLYEGNVVERNHQGAGIFHEIFLYRRHSRQRRQLQRHRHELVLGHQHPHRRVAGREGLRQHPHRQSGRLRDHVDRPRAPDGSRRQIQNPGQCRLPERLDLRRRRLRRRRVRYPAGR